MKTTIQVNGMHCSACAKLIEEELEGKVNSVSVSVVGKKAVVDFDEKKITAKQIAEAISKIGYQAKI